MGPFTEYRAQVKAAVAKLVVSSTLLISGAITSNI